MPLGSVLKMLPINTSHGMSLGDIATKGLWNRDIYQGAGIFLATRLLAYAFSFSSCSLHHPSSYLQLWRRLMVGVNLFSYGTVCQKMHRDIYQLVY